MRAIQANGYGSPDVLEPVDLPTPEPIPTEVLVRVQAAGVNPVDWKTRARGPGGMVQLSRPSCWAGTWPAWSTRSASA